jgi:SAM-dependent methyltransferase
MRPLDPEPRSVLHFGADFLDVSRTRLYTPRTLRSILEPLAGVGGGPVVDLGSGRGYFLSQYLSQWSNSEPALRLDLDAELLATGLDVARVRASAAKLPLRSQSVGTILVHFMLSRVSEAIALAALSEAARVLRPGGKLLAVEPCLGMTTYHSPWNPGAGRLMALARRMKASFQARHNHIDENFGLALPAAVAEHLDVHSVELHVARWFSAFPESTAGQWRDVVDARRRELETRDPVRDFVDAHGDTECPTVEEGPALVSLGADGIDLTTEGFRQLNRDRIDDLTSTLTDESGREAVDLIPVVSVYAVKG